jgi:hypothetical protein
MEKFMKVYLFILLSLGLGNLQAQETESKETLIQPNKVIEEETIRIKLTPDRAIDDARKLKGYRRDENGHLYFQSPTSTSIVVFAATHGYSKEDLEGLSRELGVSVTKEDKLRFRDIRRIMEPVESEKRRDILLRKDTNKLNILKSTTNFPEPSEVIRKEKMKKLIEIEKTQTKLMESLDSANKAATITEEPLSFSNDRIKRHATDLENKYNVITPLDLMRFGAQNSYSYADLKLLAARVHVSGITSERYERIQNVLEQIYQRRLQTGEFTKDELDFLSGKISEEKFLSKPATANELIKNADNANKAVITPDAKNTKDSGSNPTSNPDADAKSGSKTEESPKGESKNLYQ